MGHYAKIENNVVVQVIVAKADVITERSGEWIKTSYNTRGGVHYNPDDLTEQSVDQSKALRKNFAAAGMIYDRERDAFYNPQPYHSWTLNETTCYWEPPVEQPIGGNPHVWNEENQTWDEVIVE